LPKANASFICPEFLAFLKAGSYPVFGLYSIEYFHHNDQNVGGHKKHRFNMHLL